MKLVDRSFVFESNNREDLPCHPLAAILCSGSNGVSLPTNLSHFYYKIYQLSGWNLTQQVAPFSQTKTYVHIKYMFWFCSKNIFSVTIRKKSSGWLGLWFPRWLLLFRIFWFISRWRNDRILSVAIYYWTEYNCTR